MFEPCSLNQNVKTPDRRDKTREKTNLPHSIGNLLAMSSHQVRLCVSDLLKLSDVSAEDWQGTTLKKLACLHDIHPLQCVHIEGDAKEVRRSCSLPYMCFDSL